MEFVLSWWLFGIALMMRIRAMMMIMIDIPIVICSITIHILLLSRFTVQKGDFHVRLNEMSRVKTPTYFAYPIDLEPDQEGAVKPER